MFAPFGLVWFGLVWFGLVWFGLVWFGLVWFGLVRFGLVWFGLVCLVAFFVCLFVCLCAPLHLSICHGLVWRGRFAGKSYDYDSNGVINVPGLQPFDLEPLNLRSASKQVIYIEGGGVGRL